MEFFFSSAVRSFVRSFVRSLIRSFVRSFVRAFVRGEVFSARPRRFFFSSARLLPLKENKGKMKGNKGKQK